MTVFNMTHPHPGIRTMLLSAFCLLLDFAVVTHSHIFRSYLRTHHSSRCFPGWRDKHEDLVYTVELRVGDQISMTIGLC